MEVRHFLLPRSNLFRDNMRLSPPTYAFARVSSKHLRNRIRQQHSSELLCEPINLFPGRRTEVKVGFVHANTEWMRMVQRGTTDDDSEPLKNYMVKMSAALTDSGVFKGKFRANATVALRENLLMLCRVEGGLMHSKKEVPINDRFYLPNFKGITNLGYHYVNSSKKEGLCGDILGFSRYLRASLKLQQDDSYLLPKFAFFEATPFLFADVALAPNRSIYPGQKTDIQDYLRASTGLGCTFLSKTVTNALAIECYLSLFVHKQKNEVGTDFQINIGLD